jgi:hypothetical protein
MITFIKINSCIFYTFECFNAVTMCSDRLTHTVRASENTILEIVL